MIKTDLKRITYLTLFSVLAFAVATFIGDHYGFTLNNWCEYFKCTTGFYGYDAIQHFIGGAFIAFSVIYISIRYPEHSLFTNTKWKNFIIIISVVALISIFWEIGECFHDYLRVQILHEHLVSLKFHFNYLDQPTNVDTMGDLTFSLLGSILAFLFLRFEKKQK